MGLGCVATRTYAGAGCRWAPPLPAGRRGGARRGGGRSADPAGRPVEAAPSRRAEGVQLKLECDEDEGRFNETLKRVAKAPVKEKPLDALKPD